MIAVLLMLRCVMLREFWRFSVIQQMDAGGKRKIETESAGHVKKSKYEFTIKEVGLLLVVLGLMHGRSSCT